LSFTVVILLRGCRGYAPDPIAEKKHQALRSISAPWGALRWRVRRSTHPTLLVAKTALNAGFDFGEDMFSRRPRLME